MKYEKDISPFYNYLVSQGICFAVPAKKKFGVLLAMAPSHQDNVVCTFSITILEFLPYVFTVQFMIFYRSICFLMSF